MCYIHIVELKKILFSHLSYYLRAVSYLPKLGLLLLETYISCSQI